jgi:hypothetical protein
MSKDLHIAIGRVSCLFPKPLKRPPRLPEALLVSFLAPNNEVLLPKFSVVRVC